MEALAANTASAGLKDDETPMSTGADWQISINDRVEQRNIRAAKIKVSGDSAIGIVLSLKKTYSASIMLFSPPYSPNLKFRNLAWI